MQSIVQTVYHSAETLLKKPHFHDCHQIILVLKGKVELCVNGKTPSARAGNIVIFSAMKTIRSAFCRKNMSDMFCILIRILLIEKVRFILC